jgi:hypothetical protein
MINIKGYLNQSKNKEVKEVKQNNGKIDINGFIDFMKNKKDNKKDISPYEELNNKLKSFI